MAGRTARRGPRRSALRVLQDCTVCSNQQRLERESVAREFLRDVDQPWLAGGVAVVTGPFGQGLASDTSTACCFTEVSTSAFVGSWAEARIAVRAPSLTAWFSVP